MLRKWKFACHNSISIQHILKWLHKKKILRYERRKGIGEKYAHSRWYFAWEGASIYTYINICDIGMPFAIGLFIYFSLCRWRFGCADAHRTCQELSYLQISATNGVELVFYQQFSSLRRHHHRRQPSARLLFRCHCQSTRSMDVFCALSAHDDRISNDMNIKISKKKRQTVGWLGVCVLCMLCSPFTH